MTRLRLLLARLLVPRGWGVLRVRMAEYPVEFDIFRFKGHVEFRPVPKESPHA